MCTLINNYFLSNPRVAFSNYFDKHTSTISHQCTLTSFSIVFTDVVNLHNTSYDNSSMLITMMNLVVVRIHYPCIVSSPYTKGWKNHSPSNSSHIYIPLYIYLFCIHRNVLDQSHIDTPILPVEHPGVTS